MDCSTSTLLSRYGQSNNERSAITTNQTKVDTHPLGVDFLGSDRNFLGNLANEFLGIISGSSVVMADDSVPENGDVSTDVNTTSRYTGNSCNSEGVTKSVAEGGLIAGAATATTGAVAGAGPGGALAGDMV